MRATSAAVGGRTSTRCNVASRGTPCLISGRFMPRRNGARPRRWIDASVLDNMAPVADDGVMTPSWHLHAHLIGQPGARDQLNTPALIVDLEALDANIAAMAAWAREAGVALRPHAKTHKSAEIGKRQIAAGAVGLCCAKLGEAEALAAEGIESILLTSPVVAPQLEYGGVQFYCGSQQHIAAYADRRAAIADRTTYLETVIAALRDAGLAPPVVTGGGTGTHRIDAELGILTELQGGSYVFMDREYAECDLGAAFATALMVDTHVISANAPGMATLDAGLKAFATEAGMPELLVGASPGSSYRFMGDEQGAVMVRYGAPAPRLGERVPAMTPHCDPTDNLYDAYHVVQGDTLVAIWPVTARGRSA